ncbi:MAG: penicillin acylase family protein [Gemmatimonadota bacterium]|jgi:acyl-homoserine lactone acylase PvdQ
MRQDRDSGNGGPRHSRVPRVHVLAVALVLVAAGCAPLRSLRALIDPADRMAASVTIIRDSWGVPHIYGPTDAAVVFGLAYAQAEDNFAQIEEDYLFALGRAAEVGGEAELQHDLVRAAFEVERLSREEYEREPSERKALWDAYAAGLNYYLRRHGEVRPRRLRHFEPWYPFAVFRPGSASSSVDGVRLRGVVADPLSAPEAALSAPAPTAGVPVAEDLSGIAPGDPLEAATGWPAASNAWAVSPRLTHDGHALLFQNPHVGFFGGGQRYEMHIESETGWDVAGFAILGTPIPRSGHNEHLGWTHTNTAADAADAYLLRFDDPADSLAFRVGNGWEDATPFEDELIVNTQQGLETRRYRFLRTRLGPVVQLPDGRRVAIRRARFVEGGSLQQWYEMGRATSLDEFRAALARTAFPISNTMYADRDGHIMFVQGNAVPRRDPHLDWTRPVEAADPSSEWQGYHSLEELPQLIDPPAGWLQNSNATPFRATDDGSNLDASAYPSYMAPEPDNARARDSRRILSSGSDWTLESWARAAFDTYVNEADPAIAAIMDEWERVGAADPVRAARVDSAIYALRDWNRVSTVESVAMTYFVLWSERIRGARRSAEPYPALRALEETVDWLSATWGTIRVAWGEINRLQRAPSSGREPYDDAAPSLPVAGAPGELGIIFNVGARPGPDGKRRYGYRGHTWVGIVEFGPRVRARSIVTFGQSADPESPHFFDQAPLYVRGEFKPAWYERADIEAHASRRYHPGEEAGG